ncbi:Nramp family divalent metal transporter [Candidatus Peregrinibacteria bacterium]|nr:Nramp family divalent metal transporter [Candidatus Peregrinibacteria bacterium]
MVFTIVGPAIIAGTANNDAGGISTYSYAGSRFGFMMLWVLLVNFITLAATQEIGVKLGIFTGKGLAALIRENFSIRWTFFAVATLFIANGAVTTSEFAGLAAALELFHISKWVTVPVACALVFFIIYKGSFAKIERFFLFISLFLLVYVVSAFWSHPDWSEALRATVTFSLPPDKEFFLVLLGVMGTTITPWGQFFIQSYVVDKGIDPKHYTIEKFEVYFSAFFTCFIAAMIMITTKQVLFDHGLLVNSAESAASALVPFLGHMAKTFFGVGFFAASLLGAFILPLTTSYCICEALGFEHGLNRPFHQAKVFYTLMAVLIALSGIMVLLPVFSLFQIMIFAQVINGMLLPVILIFLIILLNRSQSLGLPTQGKTASWIYNIITWETIIRLILVSILLVVFTLFPGWIDVIVKYWVHI